ncbi:MAG: bifunctional tetrahydrofolate synthase/dihydrofolate synthase [Methylococcaceae bacterium]|jgi:dihydrofolate synthase/folylpolyglutamate synthase|nr:bifunctional tetrahydrofolate synthase/dihydrofolate synthase [Methylococcaceae bacterium]OYV20880.1 MAG: dihydrofolate synthase / folylpolyglutamate synthase [Methylococcaceae bacterium NSP1-1]OYV23179.1 MAG: dihydrofolate synthase / folylpolyglutamate synthase [Methylococcaceae bacterium NSO1]MDD1623604.1 bifunctional tetrahydrofolate synthase/dihydrofolate synthase [Methylococcaceae bacterium]MDD1629202.1 bifunctional tetrahydrofolate synthase/dihydrofolate synthase [Methylococcaceae bact
MMRFDSLKGWLDWQESLHPVKIDLGLERAAQVYHALNPDCIKPITITVAGTNGKGSCIAYLEAIYRAQGYRVGAYSSPHILKYNERIKIDGKPVSDELICEAFARIESVRCNTSLSYFEFGTLAALDIFWRSGLDIQLLEVGLGGRLDAVNIIDPNVSLITSIGIDHIDWLGETREAIGQEKAGIFRAKTPAIIGDCDPPESLLQSAIDKDARLYCINKDFGYKKQTTTWDWFAGDRHISQLPEPGLKGEHQYRNASSVILAVEVLAKSLPVSDMAIRIGLKNIQLLGRFQLIDDKIPVLIDVGHNPEAVKTLVDYLNMTFPDKRIHAVFSMMKDKDIAGVLEIMNPVVYDWFFAPIANPRAATEPLMRKIFSQSSVSRISFGFTGFADAFNAAKNQSLENDLLLVFGSFFLVSDCLNEFEKR